MTRRKKAVLITGIVLLVLVIAVAVYAGPMFYHLLLYNPFDDRAFNRAEWTNSPRLGEADSPRGPMAEDVLHNRLHRGMTKSEVRKLLGLPNNSRFEDENHIDSYFLGHWGYMSIDGDCLIINYDASNKLKSSRIYSH